MGSYQNLIFGTMHLIQEEIGLPKVNIKEDGDFRAVISVDPLPQGYGMTLGNAVRRTLISSLPGTAITSVKVSGVSHEYTTLSGVKDSVLQVILNLKKVVFQKHSNEPSVVKLSASKSGKVKAKDIKCDSNIEILNPELELTILDKSSDKLEIEMVVEKGIGYLPITPERQKESNAIVLDAAFSPVKKVRFEVLPARVGQRTNLDKLELEIETNGAMRPEEAFRFSSQLLESYFSLFGKKSEEVVEPAFQAEADQIQAHEVQTEGEAQESYTPIETLDLSPRTLNALINGDVGSIEKLVKYNESQLLNLRGFGKKAYSEIQEALHRKGLKFDCEK